MDAQTLITSLAARGITLIPDGNSLIARPRERLTDADRDAIRQRKADLLTYLRPALDEPKRNILACPACSGNDLRVSPAGGLLCGVCGRFLFLHVEASASIHPMAPLRACGALVCPDCRIHAPSPHRGTCRVPRIGPCGSRWFWLSPYRAIKCVACEGPTDLSMVEGWVMARESEVPEEIFKLLTIETPAQ
jgi:hypothetical protein